MYWLQRQKPDSAWMSVDGPFVEIDRLSYRWASIDPEGAVCHTVLPSTDTRHLEILRNELLTYTQASTVRLQALVDLFADMVQDKPDDPEKHTRRTDALAEMIRNQIAELQVLTQPIGGGK